jgi:hypothetical protein
MICERCRRSFAHTQYLEWEIPYCSEACYRADEAEYEAAEEAREQAQARADADAEAFGPETIFDGDGRL